MWMERWTVVLSMKQQKLGMCLERWVRFRQGRKIDMLEFIGRHECEQFDRDRQVYRWEDKLIYKLVR